MGDASQPQLKPEQTSSYGYPAHTTGHHMSPAETSALHSYSHPHPPGAAMPPNWNPTPSPYNEVTDHRPPHPEAHQQHQHYAHHYGGPHPPPPPGHPIDAVYARHGSSSAPSRSPPNPPPQYPPPANGAGPPNPYYPPPPPEYRDRPPYGPPEGQPNGTQPPPLHVSTAHDMMSGQPQSAPPLGYPPSAGPPPGTPYGPAWGPGAYDPNYPRRKPVRAAQACDPCRQRKAKCDEGRPTCTHCKDNNLSCTYRDIPPQKNEKHAIAIQDKLDNVVGSIERLTSIAEQWKAQEAKIDRLITFSETQHRRLSVLESKLPESKFSVDAHDSKLDTSAYANHDLLLDPLPHSGLVNSQTAKDVIEATRERKASEDRKGTSTAAAKILDWPVIKKLIPRDQTVAYIMDTESNRGMLRLYGCGEGEGKDDAHDFVVSSPATSVSSGRPDEESSTGSSSGAWGTAQFLPPPNTSSTGLKDHVGGLGPHGGLNFDSDVVDKLHQSYLDNMYKLHPFLEKQVLRKMVATFKNKYSWDYRGGHRIVSGVGLKRKREGSDSPSSLPEESTPGNRQHPRPSLQSSVPIEHSVSNAIILLVLALGKICAYKEPLPGSVVVSSLRTSTPHTVYSDLPMTANASVSTPPPTGSGSFSGGFSSAQGRNMDIIPGLAYFAKAADILGEMPGGVDVTHVQANLLAGLYMGQLGRILPSHWYIRNACTACQVLIQSSPYKEKRLTAARRNLINFAFWSCLQLESDLLAEMDLPSSGIVNKEGEMLYEKPAHLTLYDVEGVDSSRVIEEHRHYSYQIGLRKILNDSVFHIYRENREGELPSKSVIRAFGAYLQDFRRVLNDWNWDDDDHESADTNVARLRGKYYGAKYIIHRPALYYALNFIKPKPTTSNHVSHSPATVASGSGADLLSPGFPYDGRGGDMRLPVWANVEPLEDWILEASEACIHAAIRSTTSFDKVPPRLVITNIFGTAHAQFGNCLVLAATFCSQHPQLRRLVKESQLRYLLDRTIRFLQKHEAISPSLGKDAQILQHVQARVFNLPHNPTSAASSFSSNR